MWPSTFASLVGVIRIGSRDAGTWSEVSAPDQGRGKDYEHVRVSAADASKN